MGDLRFIWREDACAPEESAWSRVQKFAYLNGFDRSDLGRIVSAVRGGNRSSASTHLNLIRRTSASETLLSVIVEQDGEHVDVAWLWPEGLKLLPAQAVAPHLRFCSSCAGVGFHTALFQLQSSVRCPIHDSPIQEACPYCGELIPYSVQGAALENPYGCRCGRVLWSDRDSSEWQGLSLASTAVLEEWRSWQTSLRDSNKPGLLGSMSQDIELLEIPGQDRDLYKELAVATSAPSIVQYMLDAQSLRPAAVKIISTGRCISSTDGSETAEVAAADVIREFRSAYDRLQAALDRYLRKTHRRCLELSEELPGWASTAQLRPFCDEIAAVQRWKDYWQKHYRYGWEDSSQLDLLARSVTRALSSDRIPAVTKGGISHGLQGLARSYLESTLASAHRLSRAERQETYYGASRAWPGLDQSSWPCWSLYVPASARTCAFLVWHPRSVRTWRSNFESGLAHERRVRVDFRATLGELENRMKLTAGRRGNSRGQPRAK